MDNSAVATRKGLLSFQSQRKALPKNCCTIALISPASKEMLKILQARLQQYMNLELPDVQAEFRQGRRARNQIANIRWITEKQVNSRKTSASVSWTTRKPLTVWIRTDCGKF